jgi:hypothetical protein
MAAEAMWRNGGQEVGRKYTGRGPGQDVAPQGHIPSDLLPPARLYLLKFPKSLKIVPPAGDQAFNAQTF